MLGVRRFGCVSAGLLTHLAVAAPALAVGQSNTVVVTSNTVDERLTRALVLIRGELSAVGLELQVRGAEEAVTSSEVTRDRLSIELRNSSIAVRVFAAGSETPLVESVAPDGPEVSAEVIAVRAVEALRAARLLPAASEREPKPAPVEAPRAVDARPAVTPTFESRPVEPSHAMRRALDFPLLQLALGPTFVQQMHGPPQTSARVSLSVGKSHGFVALGGEGSLSGLDFERNSGAAQISRRALFLQLGARVRVHRAWELNARGGIHYLHYGASGSAQPGYTSQDLEHGTGGASFSIGGAYYFARSLGVYLDLASLIAFDAARVRIANESLVTLDQPSFALGFGLLLGAL